MSSKSSRKSWTRLEEEQLVKYRKSGKTLEECAKMLKRSIGSVAHKLKKLNIRYYRRRDKEIMAWIEDRMNNKRSFTWLDCTEDIGCSKSAFYRAFRKIRRKYQMPILPRRGKSWSKREDQRLINLYQNQSLFIYDIAQKMNRSASSVYMRIHRLKHKGLL